jgi:hypothetical protein
VLSAQKNFITSLIKKLPIVVRGIGEWKKLESFINYMQFDIIKAFETIHLFLPEGQH